jgi:hypothetical protein
MVPGPSFLNSPLFNIRFLSLPLCSTKIDEETVIRTAAQLEKCNLNPNVFHVSVARISGLV